MEKYITDEHTGLQYELVGDYYLIAGDDKPEEEQRPIGIWGMRHRDYIKQHKKSLYTDLKMSCKLNNYLADLNDEAEEMFSRLVERIAKKQGITERMKTENQMLWVCRMNNIRNSAMEAVNNQLINI